MGGYTTLSWADTSLCSVLIVVAYACTAGNVSKAAMAAAFAFVVNWLFNFFQFPSVFSWH
jgi:hypothetical protein